ncbi:MAG TPA: uracil-DNA glycosylase [Gemmataceae bacterium]|nr:uracil-DNA glycosylase [Gemmataceae bacterium]
MSNGNMTLDQLRRQATQHLESLRLAGLEWLPVAPPLQLLATAPDPVVSGTAPTALFVNADDKPAAAVPHDDLTFEQRRTELEVLAKNVCACTRCPELAATRKQTVFADGRLGAELCFIGEAPGADEDAQGKPFVGAAGQLLNKIIAACGLKREEVYICNIIKCRPPGNRTPKPEEATNCRDYLMRQLELLRPKFICALGGCAAQNLLNTTTPLGKLRGRFHDYRGIPVLCTYHPAFLLPHRSPHKKRDVWEDMQLLMARMGRTIPPRAS